VIEKYLNNNMLCHGRFLVNVIPIDHPVTQAFGNQMYRWDIMDFDGDGDQTGLATTYDAGWVEAISAIDNIRKPE
jgi:hypothetical protein